MYNKLSGGIKTNQDTDIVNWIEDRNFAQWELFIKRRIKAEPNNTKKTIMIKYWEYAFWLKGFADRYLQNRYRN